MISKWYLQAGESGDIVISTRVRLARNLENYAFPAKLDTSVMAKINEQVRDIFSVSDEKLSYIEMNALTRYQAISLAERMLISPEFASSGAGRALLLSEDESVSIMLCEEDHVKIQVMQAGLSADDCFARADKLDDILSEGARLAFDEKLGFLTRSPQDLGTAMRASVMLHLPGLSSTGQINRLASTVSKLGLYLRSVYGDSFSSFGDLYLLSNQVTLGINESTAILNLTSIAKQIVSQETAARKTLVDDPVWEDKAYRALGILRNARLLKSEELLKLISPVRMAAAAGVFDISIETVNDLMMNMLPATVKAREGELLDAATRDAIRARQVREALAE